MAHVEQLQGTLEFEMLRLRQFLWAGAPPGFLCPPSIFVVYVGLCCATLPPAAFQLGLPTALLRVKHSCERI